MAEMDRTDFEFLSMMNATLDEGARMARAYLANSDPSTRRANVADLARSTVQAHTELMDKITGWLRNTTPPGAEMDQDDESMPPEVM